MERRGPTKPHILTGGGHGNGPGGQGAGDILLVADEAPGDYGLSNTRGEARSTLGIAPGRTSMRSQPSCSRVLRIFSTAMESRRKKRWRR